MYEGGYSNRSNDAIVSIRSLSEPNCNNFTQWPAVFGGCPPQMAHTSKSAKRGLRQSSQKYVTPGDILRLVALEL